MKTLTIMRADQVGKFGRFLDEHPGFSPELIGENAYVCGFRVGESFLSVEEMERLIDTSVGQQTATLLRTALISAAKRRANEGARVGYRSDRPAAGVGLAKGSYSRNDTGTAGDYFVPVAWTPPWSPRVGAAAGMCSGRALPVAMKVRPAGS